jgi:hypothetical protein
LTVPVILHLLRKKFSDNLKIITTNKGTWRTPNIHNLAKEKKTLHDLYQGKRKKTEKKKDRIMADIHTCSG